jgi:hypothetical protein
MRIRAGAEIWRQCGFGQALRSKGMVILGGMLRLNALGRERVASRNSLSGERVLAENGSVKRTGAQCKLKRPGSGGLFRLYVLASHRPSQGQGWCLARTGRRAPPIGLGTPFKSGVCLRQTAGECFRACVLSSQIRRLQAPCHARPTALGSLWVARSGRPEGSGMQEHRADPDLGCLQFREFTSIYAIPTCDP